MTIAGKTGTAQVSERARHDIDPQVALRDLAVLADQIAEIAVRTGRARPDVVI